MNKTTKLKLSLNYFHIESFICSPFSTFGKVVHKSSHERNFKGGQAVKTLTKSNKDNQGLVSSSSVVLCT